jgi:2-oxoglutarate ferredoxin oxidoreductase subunit gamma
MRGGTANCAVTVSDNPVGSPLITGDATCAIVMNLPSLEKFEQEVKPGGKILVNSSLIEKKVERNDVEVHYIPANDIAAELGNPKVANMIMLGAYLKADSTVEIDSVLEAFKKVFGPSKEKFVPLNKAALEKGADAIK